MGVLEPIRVVCMEWYVVWCGCSWCAGIATVVFFFLASLSFLLAALLACEADSDAPLCEPLDCCWAAAAALATRLLRRLLLSSSIVRQSPTTATE